MTDFPQHDPASCIRVSQVLARIGDKWSIQVVSVLGKGPRRFNELKRSIDGISQRMLTLTLRGLERDGLIGRKVTPSIPPRVDYWLTDLGQSLLDPVQALGDLALKHRTTVDRARNEYDARIED